MNNFATQLPIRPASDSAAAINGHHQEICRLVGQSLEHARQAGELLQRVKSELPHGQFTAWVKTHCEFSDRTARSYMTVASNWATIEQERQRASGLESVREAIRFLSGPEEPSAVALPADRQDFFDAIKNLDDNHTPEEWEPLEGEAVIGRLPDERVLLIECRQGHSRYVRVASFDDTGVSFTKRGINRHLLFWNLRSQHGVSDISAVSWLMRCPATRVDNPLAEFMPEWSYPEGGAN